MTTFNGYAAGERRVTRTRATLVPGGHAVAEYATGWSGGAFRLHYAVICQCGKRYTSKADMARALRSHEAHAAATA